MLDPWLGSERRKREREPLRPVGRHVESGEGSLGEEPVVGPHLEPADRDFGERREVVPVQDLHDPFREVHRDDVHVLLLLLDLAHRGVRGAVGGDDAVLAEVLVRRRRGRPEVAAESEVEAVASRPRLPRVGRVEPEDEAVVGARVGRGDLGLGERPGPHPGLLEAGRGPHVDALGVAAHVQGEVPGREAARLLRRSDRPAVEVETGHLAVVGPGQPVPGAVPVGGHGGPHEEGLSLAREAQPELDGVAVLHQLEAEVALRDEGVQASDVRVGRSHESGTRVEDGLEGEGVAQVQVLGVRQAQVAFRALARLGPAHEERGEGVLRAVLHDGAGGRSLAVPLVHPVPDGAAAGAAARLEDLPVLVEAAVAVAHRVRVLALDEGAGVSVRRLPSHVRGALVHVADDVDVRLLLGPLVVDGPGGVALVDPLRRGHEVDAVARLVAERPDDHGGVVLERLDVPSGAVEVGLFPLRLVPERLVRVVAHAVRLDVRLRDDVDPVAIGELVPLGHVRVVGRPNEVEVVLLEELDVLHHRVRAHVLGGLGVPLVAVDAADEDGLSVDEDLPVLRLHLAESDPPGHDAESSSRPRP